ncbi:MAG: hypothetical protein Q8M66_04000, partial [Actinomycetota bacterium]|nr:hypothetical protein [Actinomycetota bacterium]
MKICLLLVLLFICKCLAYGLINEYVFAQSAETYVSITGGNVVATGAADDESYSIPVPFTFLYDGNPVTAMRMSANGWFSFNSGTSSFDYSPISSTTTGQGVITPLGRNLVGRSDGELRYQVFGTSPSQYAVYQWKNWRISGANYANVNLNFQIILHETSNQIAFRYGSFNLASSATTNAQVGIRGASNADFLNRATTTNWNATTAGTGNTATCSLKQSVYPASGLQFLFAPPAAPTPPNPAIALYPANGAIWVPTGASLNWVNDGDMPTGYKLYFGTSNPPQYVGNLGNVTSWSPPVMNLGQTYYWKVVPYNAFGDAIGCPVWSFQTMPANPVQIGTGSNPQPLPINAYFTYSYSQTYYLASEIGAAGVISSIAYYWNGNAPNSLSNAWTVYMKQSPNGSFATNTAW